MISCSFFVYNKRSFFSVFLIKANESSIEHETLLQTLEKRWQALYKQITACERDIEKILFITTFDDEFQKLTEARNEYQVWIDSSPASNSTPELQVGREKQLFLSKKKINQSMTGVIFHNL